MDIVDLELLVAEAAVEDELLLVGLLDEACFDSLTHQVGGHLAGLVLLLERLHLLLEIGQLRHLRLHVGLALGLRVGLELEIRGRPPLRPCLSVMLVGFAR